MDTKRIIRTRKLSILMAFCIASLLTACTGPAEPQTSTEVPNDTTSSTAFSNTLMSTELSVVPTIDETVSYTEPLTIETESSSIIESTENPTELHTDIPTNEPAEELPEYETVYATTKVNVRSGPGTNYKKIGSLAFGKAVRLIEEQKNGWSKVLYEDEVAFVCTKYLSKTEPAEAPATSNKENSDKDSSNKDTSSESNKSDSKDSDESKDTPASGNDTSSGNTSGGSTTNDDRSSGSGGNTSSDSSTNAPSGIVQAADPATGISWDGKSAIIYTYTDGSKGTTPKNGATYEMYPGVTRVYVTYESTLDKDEAGSHVHYCDYCGRVMGDGANGTCLRWSLVGGDHNCTQCGATVPASTCHNCS